MIQEFTNVQNETQHIGNVRCGTICATIANSQRGKKSDRVYSWKDFFREYEPDKPKPKRLDMQTTIRFQQLAAHFEAQRKRGKA